jgi:hypothetical protein
MRLSDMIPITMGLAIGWWLVPLEEIQEQPSRPQESYELLPIAKVVKRPIKTEK